MPRITSRPNRISLRELPRTGIVTRALRTVAINDAEARKQMSTKCYAATLPVLEKPTEVCVRLRKLWSALAIAVEEDVDVLVGGSLMSWDRLVIA